MASSLTTYTFFYSQYHQTFLSIASYIDYNTLLGELRTLNRIYDLLESIRIRFLPLYNQCLRKHPHPKIYYERGMIYLHSNEAAKALSDIQELIKFSDAFPLTSEIFQQEGEAYCELGLYDKAIASLTEAIKRDPENKDSYFHRAFANFETGNFEQALNDYQLSKKIDDILLIKSITPSEFRCGLLNGLCEGGVDGAVDFFPSLWNSIYGMYSNYKELCKLDENPDPKKTLIHFSNECYRMAYLTRDYYSKINWDTAEDCVYEYKDFYNSFDKLSYNDKGHKIGYMIGKYGIDIFAGGASVKGAKALANLKNANKICVFEEMLASEVKKEAIIAAAKRHEEQRNLFFKNVKIEWDKQNKHVPGTKNYMPGRSILEHNDPESLLQQFKGTGTPYRGVAGNPGYQEIVDFKEHIGKCIFENESVKIDTTKGKIHYSKTGGHIVPFKPN